MTHYGLFATECKKAIKKKDDIYANSNQKQEQIQNKIKKRTNPFQETQMLRIT